MRAAYLFASDWTAWDANDAGEAFDRLAGQGFTAVMTETDVPTPQIVEHAHRCGLEWIAAFPCFSDHLNGNRLNSTHPSFAPIEADGNPRAQSEWYLGLSPASAELRSSRARASVDLAIGAQVDALVLDFVRWPMHWELECREANKASPGSFDDAALAGFAAWIGSPLSGPMNDRVRAELVAASLGSDATSWDDYRCAVITEFVANVVAELRTVSSIPVGATLVPVAPDQLRSAVGQDLTDIAALVDWVMPMAYHAILERGPKWVGPLLTQFEERAPGRVVPIVQCDASRGAQFGADWGPPISEAQRQEVLDAAQSATTSESVVLFPGSLYLSD